MDLDRVLLTIGATPVTLAQVLLTAAGVAMLLLVFAVAFAFRAQSRRRDESLKSQRRADDLELRLAELTGHLRSFADQTQTGQAHIARTLEDRLEQVSLRLGHGLSSQSEKTANSLQHLYERLAVIDKAQTNLAQLSSEMLSLKDILSNKQARGAYGQARMEAIIRDGLHARSYSFQDALSNGTRPDCLIRLPDTELKLVIDAKFPLEAFNALRQAKGDADTRAAEVRLRQDVGRHVRDIAQKYHITGETHETAIMFVPSESIYADLHERFEDVIQRSHRERVIIASPNILMLLIQTLQALFKDVAMREQAGVIKREVSQLLDDVGRVKDRVLDLQRHFGQASGDLEKLGVSADKIAKRGLRIEAMDLEELPKPDEPPRPRLVTGP